MDDIYIALANADVVEWPRLSQQVRLEREQATHCYSVTNDRREEVAIFYALAPTMRYCIRNGCGFDRKPILRQF